MKEEDERTGTGKGRAYSPLHGGMEGLHLNTGRPAKLFGHGQDGHAHADSVHVAQQKRQSSWSNNLEERQSCKTGSGLYDMASSAVTD